MNENTPETRSDPVVTIKKPLPVLTSFRFIAAMLVIIHHYPGKDELLSANLKLFSGVFQAGYQAVTFFFVLSGFVLAYVYSGPREYGGPIVRKREFLRARIARILPAYYLAILLSLPTFIYAAFLSKIVPIDVFIVALVLVPLFLQSWYPPTAFALNGPAWSLSVEMVFYVLFHYIVRIGRSMSCKTFVTCAYIIVVLVATARYLWFSTDEIPFNSFTFNFRAYFPLFHMPQFVFGVALGRSYVFGKRYTKETHSAVFIFGCIGIVIMLSFTQKFPMLQNDSFTVALFGCIIYGGAQVNKIIESCFKNKLLILLGESSYSLYILQIPAILWWNQMTKHVVYFKGSPILEFYFYVAVLPTASILSYLYFETPLRRSILGHKEHRSA